jgi:pilus assembly protein CpaF
MGYGPLEELLKDPDVNEIMVNGPNKIFVEKKGKLQLTQLRFRNDEHVMNVIDRIVSQVGRHIDEASPMVDARLKDGSRVNAIIPPISLTGPTLTIRKFSKNPYTANIYGNMPFCTNIPINIRVLPGLFKLYISIFPTYVLY